MFEYFHGEVAERGDGSAVLDVNGVAYRLACSASTLRRLPPRGPARLFAHLVVREDRQELYGFFDRAERHLFRQLLQVLTSEFGDGDIALGVFDKAALSVGDWRTVRRAHCQHRDTVGAILRKSRHRRPLLCINAVAHKEYPTASCRALLQ